ncbi:MAG: metallophosphoesterase family protein [Geothermobacteraceae bacterium]
MSSAPHDDKQKRMLAIGDIHGCLDLFDRLLDRVALMPEDRLILLGDLIDRGPDSYAVVERVLELRNRLPGLMVLRGNHEQMLLDYLAGRDTLMFLANGGDATLSSYRRAGFDTIPDKHRDFFAGLPTLHREDGFIFVHAGLRPGIPVEQQQEEDLLWIRGPFLHSDWDFGATVVFGHTPQADILRRPGRIGLDTGAVYGGSLSCVDLTSGRCWSVPAR